ncbi:hypothetical protein A5881_002374 [Enterococcus termitis]|nr:hypothetical protein A5881_001308 [Enterococcus termitis]
MKKGRRIIILCLFIVLAGCSKQNLSETNEDFSDDDYNYTFQLPKGWRSQEEYKNLYNETAIFGAEDKNSKSYMFIRTTKKNETNVAKFKQKTEKALKKAYDLKDIYDETFEVDDFPVIAYTFQGSYDNENVFVHDFYVILDQQVVEFTFYSALEGNYEKRADRFAESVRTFSIVDRKSKTTESLPSNSNNQIIKNEEVSFTLTGYKIVTGPQNKRLLIIRYVFANNMDKPNFPNMWNTVVHVEQDGKELKESSITENEEASDLGYLLKVGKSPVSKNDSVESASVYELIDSSTADVLFIFDDNQFKDSKPIHLPIRNT